MQPLFRRTHRFPALPLIILGTATGATAELAWTPASEQAMPEVVAAGFVPEGFKFEIAAPPGEYELQRSTTLLPGSWQPLGVMETSDGSASNTDPAALSLPAAFYRIEGGFDELPMKLIAFDVSVTSGGIAPNFFGGLWTGHAHQDFLLQKHPDSDEALVKFFGERFTSFRIEPANSMGIISAVVESRSEVDVLPVGFESDRWLVDADIGEIPFFKLEGGDHSLIGMVRDSNTSQFGTPQGTYSSTEEAISTLLVISKSEDADPADLAGDWGFVRIMVDGVESDGIFGGLSFTTSVTAGPGPRPIAITSITDFEIEHIWAEANVDWYFETETIAPAITTALDLAPDGTVSIADPDDGPPFSGIVSPSAKLLVATKSDPDLAAPGSGDTNEFLPGLDGAEVQYLVGVKRTNSPQLAGKSYRIIRQGWWIADDGFEIDASGEVDRLVFNAAGTSAVRTSSFDFQFVDFAGGMGSDSDTIVQPMTVDISAGGKITLEGGVAGDYHITSFGFAQEGSKLLILVDAIETEEDGAGLGLIIAIEEP